MEKAALYIVGFIGLVVFIGLLTGIPIYFLWNWLMPTIFRLPEITFWQALGLSVLCSLLFKNNTSSKKG
jgi:hypothetical protein